MIRRVLKLFKAQGIPTPIEHPVLIAVSGGVDSMALAHLAGKYGRNLIDPKLITLLHLDHGWRAESSTEEPRGVESLAKSLGVGYLHEKLDPPDLRQASDNLEEDARFKRLEVYDRLAGPGKQFRFVWTAHHRDDVAETVLWRFLRGEFAEGAVGIKFLDYQCLRPFLEVSKEQIIRYAKEEGFPFFEDATNRDSSRFRGWVRAEVLPLLERFYPSIRKTLAGYSHHRLCSESPAVSDEEHGLPNLLQAVIDGPLNRVQRSALSAMAKSATVGQVICLPDGVQLKRLKTGWMIENSDEGNQA
ncbi:MAG: tRNA lysidine(34) synthetase TilS [Bdellovibrionales bacterium]|nr:tRNA lysidine(34) synthetase TilS [Bdellovibrionales bacterium]